MRALYIIKLTLTLLDLSYSTNFVRYTEIRIITSNLVPASICVVFSVRHKIDKIQCIIMHLYIDPTTTTATATNDDTINLRTHFL